MPKSSKSKVTDSENKVIEELKKDSSKSVDTIAKEFGFSRQKVWRIKKQLESNKTIWGYSAVIDEEKRGYTNYIILIKFSNGSLDDKLVDSIIEGKLKDIITDANDVNIESDFFVYGQYDWVLSIHAKDVIQAKKFCESLNILCEGQLEKIDILENVCNIRKNWILNPDNKSKQTLKYII